MSEEVAGREIDVLVAEKVMGLTIAHRDWPCYTPPDGSTYEAAVEDDGGAVPWGGERGPVYFRGTPYVDNGTPESAWYEPVPFYSTDIAAAWLVVERVATIDKGEPGGLEVAVIRYPDRWECHIETNSAAFLCIEEASTAPLAICLATLRAIEVRQ